MIFALDTAPTEQQLNKYDMYIDIYIGLQQSTYHALAWPWEFRCRRAWVSMAPASEGDLQLKRRCPAATIWRQYG